jgi:hypothetical protein
VLALTEARARDKGEIGVRSAAAARAGSGEEKCGIWHTIHKPGEKCVGQLEYRLGYSAIAMSSLELVDYFRTLFMGDSR